MGLVGSDWLAFKLSLQSSEDDLVHGTDTAKDLGMTTLYRSQAFVNRVKTQTMISGDILEFRLTGLEFSLTLLDRSQAGVNRVHTSVDRVETPFNRVKPSVVFSCDSLELSLTLFDGSQTSINRVQTLINIVYSPADPPLHSM